MRPVVEDATFAIDGADWLDIVAAGAGNFCALKLDAPEVGASTEDEVKRLAVSPGLGDEKTEDADFENESGFRDFSGALGVTAEAPSRWHRQGNEIPFGKNRKGAAMGCASSNLYRYRLAYSKG